MYFMNSLNETFGVRGSRLYSKLAPFFKQHGNVNILTWTIINVGVSRINCM